MTRRSMVCPQSLTRGRFCALFCGLLRDRSDNARQRLHHGGSLCGLHALLAKNFCGTQGPILCGKNRRLVAMRWFPSRVSLTTLGTITEWRHSFDERH